ncbi:hypothetical protein ACSENN_25605, partial [Enterobacter hormaechei subsp. hoffmannii]|uniref:hypothetical protein n=1 Tax=Enterobacter hormaechei TaxID=158836 RepID=UPI003EEB0747
EWVHVQLHQQKGMISLSPPTICNSAIETDKHELESATIVSHDFFITFMVLFFTYHTASYEYEACNGRYRN